MAFRLGYPLVPTSVAGRRRVLTLCLRAKHWPVGQPNDASQSMHSDFGTMVDKNQHPERCSAQRRRALPKHALGS
jgi:hypothetical protein